MKLSDIFKRNKKKKKSKKEKYKTITKSNIKPFLADVLQSIDQTFSGQESHQLEKFFANEVENWLQATVAKGGALDEQSVKLGVCLGVRKILSLINEAEEEKNVATYIS